MRPGPVSSLRRPVVLRSVLHRALHEHRRSVLAWSSSLFTLVVMVAAVFPTIRGNQQIVKLYDNYPKALRSLFGITDLTTGPGYMNAEIFSLMAPLLVIVFAVLWGGDLISGEEERGTMDILLANPISRRRLLIEKWAALAAGSTMAGAALAAGLAFASPIFGLGISVEGAAAAVVSVVLLGLLYGTVALAVGATTGHRGLARGATTGLAVAAYLISSLAGLVGWLKPVRPLSPWYHALGTDPLTHGFVGVHLLVLPLLTAALLIGSVYFFDRRDLAV